MDTTDQNLTIEDFSRWKSDSLKMYLRIRDIPTTGNKNELMALAYSAHVMKTPVKKTVTELQVDKSETYKKMLTFDDKQLPDPLQIYENWVGEGDGMRSWPPIFITDITQFLMRYEKQDRVKQHLNQYKIGKAYQYFKSEHLKEIFYHNIDKTSKFCFLRSKCIPSQSLQHEPHIVWLCCEKENGDIKSAFCTCAAGYGQTCNHVAAILFRVEYAHKMGYTASTSNKCEWVVPGGKKLEPAKIQDMVFEKSKHGKTGKAKTLSSKEKKLMHVDTVPESARGDDFLKSFSTAIKDSLPNACLFKGLGIERSHEVEMLEEHQTEDSVFIELEDSTDEIIKHHLMDSVAKQYDEESNNHTHIKEIKISSNTISQVNKCTIGQSSNKNWHAIRKGRITSSNFYSVHTRIQTIEKKSSETPHVKPLIDNIMGYKKMNPNIKSLKHGRETEPIAKRDFLKSFSAKHEGAQSEECGIFIGSDRPYIAASPDLLISCNCCGEGCLEIKCPLVPKCDKCKGFCKCKLPSCLTNKSGELKLKSNHSYYAQIQGQMFLTNRHWCEFYIYTCNGTYSERIVKDNVYFLELLSSIDKFFFKYILPEFNSNVKGSKDSSTGIEPMDIDENVPETEIVGDSYFCPICNYDISNTTDSLKDKGIQCETCGLCFHRKCANVNEKTLRQNPSWVCNECLYML